MSKTLLVLRHGETSYNATRELVGGQSNHLELSEKGKRQAAHAGSYFAGEGLRFDTWYSSPALRAIDTGRIVMDATGHELEPVIDERLLEQSQGIYEGKPRNQVWTPEVKARAEAHGMPFKLRGGESLQEVQDRMMDFVMHWSEVAQDETLSLATGHGTATQCMVAGFEGYTRQQLLDLPVPNCSLTSITADHEGVRIDYAARNIIPEV